MKKQRKWRLLLILSVVVLTIYNILPTLFYYSKPLKSPISSERAEKISYDIQKRLEEAKEENIDWINSFCKLIHVEPKEIQDLDHTIHISFLKSEEAKRFRQSFPKASASIANPWAQMALVPTDTSAKDLVIQRRLSAEIDPSDFLFAKKGSPLYRDWIIDRTAQVANALAGISTPAAQILSTNPQELEHLATEIQSIKALFPKQKSVANRFAARFTQGPFASSKKAIESLMQRFDEVRDEMKQSEEKGPNRLLFAEAKQFLKDHEALFSSGLNPLSLEEIKKELLATNQINLGKRNPLFSKIAIDFEQEQIQLTLHPDVNPSLLKQQLINESAKVAHMTGESIETHQTNYTIALHDLPELSSVLLLDLDQIKRREAKNILEELENNWNPTHPDLKSLKIVYESEFGSLSPQEAALSMTIHQPKGENRSLFIETRGIEKVQQSYQGALESEAAQTFLSDLRSLLMLMRSHGFEPRMGANNELLFTKPDLIPTVLAATREDFTLKGTQKYAALDLSTYEQRLRKENQIDSKIHADLIQWRDDFNAAQVSLHKDRRFDVPKPTKNVFLSNLFLSWKKMVRGDETKVIRWGLDLSGGKTVQIELRDQNNKRVENEIDIKQGINELYNRVNKMGVSEVAIRQLGNNIVLDFPGSQSLSAKELIKASSMYFHVVNEKFSSSSSPYKGASEQFLQEVWNEAVVTNRKDPAQIEQIAYEHLYQKNPSEAAKTLLKAGLKLYDTDKATSSQTVDDAVSKVVLFRSNPRTEQSHPLLFVFNNYALEGSQLDGVQANYDPQKGNYLSFQVQKSSINRAQEEINPQAALYKWTSRYSKEKVSGTKLEEYAQGQGWRMAVVLNDTVISAPLLGAVIRDSASISGQFSQREVQQLATDLKAGSLTFTPKILSEKNVSPELGKKDRIQGITATVVALVLVIFAMIAYYRFAGLVASIAVIFNLLMMWATLQNIGAALSLAGIAGIILTVGMAVDANVLVFERIKEEFAQTQNMKSAIQAGYKKAYSAIIDSNVTTIIAAMILLGFDAGPIKGFAITLIIGIASSMFSALFMTKYYFNGWVERQKQKVLKMANWIKPKSINFLKQARRSFLIASMIIMIGSALVYTQRATIFGMDFTGGFSLHVEVDPESTQTPLASVEKALTAKGATQQDMQIRELNPKNHLRILFGTSMEQPGKPFYQMISQEKTHPQIEWVLSALAEENIALTPKSLKTIESNWTAMSGQMSDSMRNNALLGLFIAFCSIFIYIAIRFEYKFAISSILCVIHDVLITIACLGILSACNVPVQIDLNTIAAIMTIVGYSLNDTIIIFDRIREEMHLKPKQKLAITVNQALNATLSRTTITSATTLLVLIALVLFGGASIFSFALVMAIGVVLGTLSSWYIAAPLMLMFHKKEEEPQRVSVK